MNLQCTFREKGTDMEDRFRQGALPPFVRGIFPRTAAMPLGWLLTGSVRALARRRPQLFDRLGEHRTATYFVDPTDLAFAFIVIPDGEKAVVRIVGKAETATSNVVIRGPLLMLLGLLDGTLDGDALFFRRIVSVSGRTEAVVALRNAIEDAELTPADLLGFRGTLARLADTGILGGLNAARRLAAQGFDQAAQEP